ncbi:glycosyltransferase [Salinibacterium soli]|nr:glycosyltransferase [Protaetiibacter sp. WY-16]
MPVWEGTVRPEHVGILLLAPLLLGSGTRSTPVPRPVLVGLALWLAVGTLSSLLFAPDPLRSIYIVALITASLVAFVAVSRSRVDKALLVEVGTWVLAALSTGSLLVLLLAPEYPVGTPWVTAYGDGYGDGATGRIVGLAFEPNIMGGLSSVWVALVVYHRRRLSRAALVATSTIVLAAVLTLTRASWVALAVTLVVALVAARRTRAVLLATGIAVVAGVGALALAVATAPRDAPWLERLVGLLDLSSGTGAFRVATWVQAMQDLAASGSWAIGLGVNTFQQRHVPAPGAAPIEYFSNAWLAQLHDTGMIGTVALLASLVGLWAATRRRLDALAVFATLAITAAFANPLWFAYPWVVLALLEFRPRRPSAGNARIYPMARVSHLERLPRTTAADFLYSRHRADWDERLAASLPDVHRSALPGILVRVSRRNYATIETPEPLALPLTGHLVALSVLVVGLNALLGRTTRLVCYALENLDPVDKLVSRSRLPRWIAIALLRASWAIILLGMRRIAFGTEGALENYRTAFGPLWRRVESRIEVAVFPALPAAAEKLGPRDPRQVCFLGGFQVNKGIRELLAAWPLVEQARPDARLLILGQGPLLPEVLAVAESTASVQLEVDPPRDAIRDRLRSTTCLVLLSRRTATFREQVGLPLVEGLEHGCEVVTTYETGIAQWLVDHGHRVLERTDPESVAGAVLDALAHARTPEQIVAPLPERDSRLAADAWMFAQ